MLQVNNLVKKFGTNVALNNVSFVTDKPEVIGVIGRSGAGKSTLLRTINRLNRATSGEVLVDGVDVLKLRGDEKLRWQKDCAMIFQQFNLVERLDVLTNVLIGRLAEHDFLSSMAMRFTDMERAMALQALDRLDLVPQALQRAGTLSGGQQQRVALARALAPKPSVILLDEPYAGLDSRLRERIRDQMLHVLKATKTAALMVTHDAEEAMFMSDRIVVLRDGHVVQTGRPVNLYCQPSSAFVAEFFGEVNRVEGTVANKKVTTPLGDFDAPNGLPRRPRTRRLRRRAR